MTRTIFKGLCAMLLTFGVSQANAQGEVPRLIPADRAVDVNVDTQLVFTFDSPPTIGTSGFVRVFDAQSDETVDALDMSIPASPRPTGRVPRSTEAERQAFAAATKMSDYQVNTIGGVDFHFFPIIVRDNKATIHLHNNKLKYVFDRLTRFALRAQKRLLSVSL